MASLEKRARGVHRSSTWSATISGPRSSSSETCSATSCARVAVPGKEGLHWLPAAISSRSIHRYTTLLQAGEIHEIGLQQNRSASPTSTGNSAPAAGTTDLQDIFTRLRDDPELHHTTGEGVRAAAETTFEKARARNEPSFGRLPEASTWSGAEHPGVLLPSSRKQAPAQHVS